MDSKGATGVGVYFDFSEIDLSHTVSVIEHDLEVWENFFLKLLTGSLYLRKGVVYDTQS